MNPVFRPVRELAEEVRARRVSPVALAETFLERLQRLGPRYNAVVTVTRERALDQARREGFDLLLLDFAMPGMNGAELAKQAAQRRPRLPILFVSGYADLSALAEVDQARVLSKPFDQRELARRLSEVLAAAGSPAA